MRETKALLVVVLLLGAPSRAQETVTEEGKRQAWKSTKSYTDDYYVIVKKDGTAIRAAGAFEVKNGMAVFRSLVNFKAGPLTSIPVDELDLPATEKANQVLKESPQPPKRPSDGSVPIYDTKDISSVLETEEKRKEREHIKRRREEARQAEIGLWEAEHPDPLKAPPSTEAKQTAISPEDRALASMGRVRKGMKAAAVQLSWGSPDKREAVTIDGQIRDRWTYLVKGRAPYLVTLVAGAVVQIENDERLIYEVSLKESPPPAPPESSTTSKAPPAKKP